MAIIRISELKNPHFQATNITVMAIDNLPGELPRDASLDFGKHADE